MEKPTTQATVSVHASEQEVQDVDPVSKWTPGYFRRFPFVGALSLGLIAALACASLGVLIGSDQRSSSTWPQRIAPNVVLSLLNAFSSLALAVAVAEGVAIAWWRKAMGGSTIAQLHEQWSLTTGLFAGLFRPKALTSSIALAVLATQVTLLNSILYQRATSTYVAQDAPRIMQAVGIGATKFPMTGYVVSNTSFGAQTSCACFMVGDSFTPVVNSWETSNGFFAGYNELFRFSKNTPLGGNGNLQYCDGLCYASFEAIGFEIDCVDRTNHTDIAVPAIAAYKSGGNSSAWTNLPIFNSSFGLEYATEAKNYSQILLNLQYFQSDDPYNPKSTTCPGTVFTKQCSLRPAIVRYPLQITNFTNTHIVNGVSLGSQNGSNMNSKMLNNVAAPPKYSSSLKQAEGFEVVSYLYPNDTHTVLSLTALGGIASAMSQFLSSTATITYSGDEDWSLTQVGILSQTMMYGPPNMGSCDCSFKNEALDTIINSINQLAFLTGVGLVDTTPFRGLPQGKNAFPSTMPQALVVGVDNNDTTAFRAASGSVTQITDVVHYKTHYLFAGLAFGITILCIILVVPSFWHYGELGRQVTLGPMEIASAFGAPILVDDSHKNEASGPAATDIDNLIKKIGDRKIVYGFVDVDEDGMGRREIRQQQSNSPSIPPSPHIPQSPIVQITPPPTSPALTQDETSRMQKRRSVRLAMGRPESVRPTSMVIPTSSPRLGTMKE